MIPDLSTLLLLGLFFVVLSPGLLLSLPPNSREYCANLGISDCDTPGGPLYSVDCNKCTSVWASQQTSRWTIFFHTLIQFALSFGLLVLLAPKASVGSDLVSTTNLVPILGSVLQYNTVKQTAVLCGLATLLFFLLSPGMLITLPPNDEDQCQNVLNIQDCTTQGPDCKKCTSFWISSQTNTAAVFVHLMAFLLGVVAVAYIVRV